ncbi:hypothetical protein COO60DRAFT_1541420 [Scenedesmus sp. NREL 46B-D3]|nr:hypothetical protein COO60DRAFT_1541420 [Scenedesmus sp. NREL 46B-D3]
MLQQLIYITELTWCLVRASSASSAAGMCSGACWGCGVAGVTQLLHSVLWFSAHINVTCCIVLLCATTNLNGRTKGMFALCS